MFPAEIKCSVCTNPMIGEISPFVLMPCRCILHDHCMKIFKNCAHGDLSTLKICKITITKTFKSTSGEIEEQKESSPSMIEANHEEQISNFVTTLFQTANQLIKTFFNDSSQKQLDYFEFFVNTVFTLLVSAQKQNPSLGRVTLQCKQKIEDGFIDAFKKRLEQFNCEVTENTDAKYPALDVFNGKSHVLVIFTNGQS